MANFYVSPLLKNNINRKSPAFNELYWVKKATVFAGSMAILIGIAVRDISYLGYKALEVVGPMLLFPFIAGVVGLKPDKKSFFSALLVTWITFVIATVLLPVSYSHFALLISILANGITFFSVHGRMNTGFKRAKRSTTVA